MHLAPSIELAITRRPDGTTTAALRIELPQQRLDPVRDVPLALDDTVLRALSLSPDVYGATLTAMVFPPTLREAWQATRGFADGQGHALQVRLALEGDEVLHAVRWELLRDPIDQTPLAHSERIRFSRFLPTASFRPLQLPARPDLRAVVAVANPPTLPPGMAPVDVAGEVARAQQGLGAIPATVLDGGDGRPRATLPAIAAALRDEPAILYLVCHGGLVDGQPFLWLEQEGRDRYQPIPGAELVQQITHLGWRPLLIVLAACQSAGDAERTLAAVGPRLAQAGVGAVVAMRGDVPMELVADFAPRLFRELGRDGRIDRALAAARTALPADQPWWMPVLWMAVRDGALWRQDTQTEDRPADAARLRALTHDQSGFVSGRLERFVGRSAELAELGRLTAELRPQGGYIIVHAQAGQGKSTLLARLVADEAAPTGDLAQVVCHFVPLDPGPDHQVTLLRNLLARLCLRHDLPEHYALGETRAALRDAFGRALQEFAQREVAVTIFIDGLDQLEPEPDGGRDLSFLPDVAPPGVLFVLGTRPDDTLQRLLLREPQHLYLLPPLSRTDFTELLASRGAHVAAPLADRLYASLRANVLYLDLAARELALSPNTPPARLLARIADDPQHLFTLSMSRLRRQRGQWRTVIKPLLGVLLVVRRSLSRAGLRRLLEVDDEELRDGLERLGGLLLRDGWGNYILYHLKLRDYLREDPARPEKPFVFAADEERAWHGRVAAWCTPEQGTLWDDTADPVEHERRSLARRQSVYHLARAGAYERLWALLDGGPYVPAKLRYDPSTRSLALDLDDARQAVIDAASGDAERSLALLPRLWRYSIVRVGLAGRADRYPQALFLTLVALGRAYEAEALADLLTDPMTQVETLIAIGGALFARGEGERARTLLLRVRELAGDFPDNQQIALLVEIIDQFIQVGDLLTAQALIDELPEERTAGLNNRGYALVRCAVAATRAAGVAAGEAMLQALPEAQRDEGRAEATEALASLDLIEAAQTLAAPIQAALPRLRAEAVLANRAAQRAAEEGDHGQVLVLATGLLIPHERERVVQHAAWRAAWAGHPEVARKLLAELAGGFARARALAALAATTGDEARAEAAFAAAYGLEFDDRNRALAGLARDMAAAGRTARAEEALEAIGSVYHRALATVEVARHLVAAGVIDAACAHARALPALRPDGWQFHIAAIVGDLVRADHAPAAEALLGAIVPEEGQGWASGVLALAFAQSGHIGEASRWLDQSRRRAAGLAHQQVGRNLICQTVALALATVGTLDAALEVANEIGNPRERTAAQVEAALLADDPERALALAATVAEDDARALVLGNLARLLCERGRLRAARTLVVAMPPGYQREQAGITLVAALAANSQLAEAEVLAGGFEDIRFRAKAYATLSVAFRQAGNIAEAKRALDACQAAVAVLPPEREGLREEAVAALGAGLVALGELDEARALLGLLPPGGLYQSELVCHLIWGLVGAGRVSEGGTLARQQPAGHPRDGALAALCGVLAARGELATAEAIVGEWGTEAVRFQRQRAIVEGLLSAGNVDAAADRMWLPPLSGDVGLLCQVALELTKRRRGEEGLGLFDLAAWVTQHPLSAAQRPTVAVVLTAALAEAGQHNVIVGLTENLWRAAQTSEELVTLLPAAAPLLVVAPELGPALLTAYDQAIRQLSEMA